MTILFWKLLQEKDIILNPMENFPVVNGLLRMVSIIIQSQMEYLLQAGWP